MSNGGHSARNLDRSRNLDSARYIDRSRNLDRSTCLSLLSSVGLGRVGLSVDALPVIVPVGFHVSGDRIVFALCPSDRAAASVNGVVVVFEADDVDPMTGDGWTVMVQGPARVLADPVAHGGRGHTVPECVGPDEAYELVAMSTDVITGRLSRLPAGHRRRCTAPSYLLRQLLSDHAGPA